MLPPTPHPSSLTDFLQKMPLVALYCVHNIGVFIHLKEP